MRGRSLGRSLATADLALFTRAARPWPKRLSAVESALPRLTRAADHGRLWLGLAGVLAAAGGRPRRSAVRGVLSLGFASASVNAVAKLAVRRQRPPLTAVPLTRQLASQPWTSSFPSGHSASAAAFAAGVALEDPWLGAPLGVLAAAVAYSRVHTGVHYPGDVAAGIAIGVGAAYVTTRLWPPRPDRPARARPASVGAPAAPEGDGVVVVVNPRAGKAERQDIADALRKLLPRAEIVELREDDDPEQVFGAAASRAHVLGVAGGDGTVNCAAKVALERGCPLMIVPSGTLDHFCADLGVTSVEDAVDALRDGEAVEVTLGEVHETDTGQHRIFLNTASVGGYPEMVAMRERFEDSIGKWLAVAIALVRVLRTYEPLLLRIDGEERRVWLSFIGNGIYHPNGFAPSWRERLDGERLDVRIVDAVQPWARTRLVLAVLTGRLGRTRVYEQYDVSSLHIDAVRTPGPGHRLRLATDGEVGTAGGSLRLAKHPQRLVVYRPAAEEGTR